MGHVERMEGALSMKLYLKNEQTGKRYEIVKLDKAAGKVTLRGETAEFVEEYSKERMQRLGYVLEKAEKEDA